MEFTHQYVVIRTTYPTKLCYYFNELQDAREYVERMKKDDKWAIYQALKFVEGEK